jgi:hypothetical protein
MSEHQTLRMQVIAGAGLPAGHVLDVHVEHDRAIELPFALDPLHEKARNAAISYIPDGRAYDGERAELLRWVDLAALALRRSAPGPAPAPQHAGSHTVAYAEYQHAGPRWRCWVSSADRSARWEHGPGAGDWVALEEAAVDLPQQLRVTMARAADAALVAAGAASRR